MRHVLLILLSSFLIAATGPERPTSKWRVDYGDTQCVAMRLYGERTLMIRPSPRGESTEILLIEKGVTGRGAMQSDGSVTIGDDKLRSTALVYSDPQSQSRIAKFRLSSAEIAPIRHAGRIVLGVKNVRHPIPSPSGTRITTEVGGASADLLLDQMGVVMDSLGKCIVDLREYWNDKPGSVAVARAPSGDVRAVFSADDYPGAAAMRNQGGSTQALLMVDEKGAVAGCYNELPSGIASLDAISCEVIMSRARFVPAKDANGKAIKSMVMTPKITFQMEGSGPPPPLTK